MKQRKTVILLTVMGVLFLSMASAQAAGYPMAGVLTEGNNKIVIVGKFDQSGFSSADAEHLTSTVSTSLSLAMGLSQGISTYTPSQLSPLGITDADVLKNLMKSQYKAAGFNYYIFLDITRKPGTFPAAGDNMRIDIWVADMAFLLQLQGDYLYLASVELPLKYADMLGTLIKLL